MPYDTSWIPSWARPSRRDLNIGISRVMGEISSMGSRYGGAEKATRYIISYMLQHFGDTMDERERAVRRLLEEYPNPSQCKHLVRDMEPRMREIFNQKMKAKVRR